MTAGVFSREVLYDRCACGRRKQKAQYVCAACLDKSERLSVAGYCLAHGKWVEVVSCPGNEFPRGGHFPAKEFGLTSKLGHRMSNTLEMGHWTPGMVIRDWLGREWRVCGEVEAAEWLEAT